MGGKNYNFLYNRTETKVLNISSTSRGKTVNLNASFEGLTFQLLGFTLQSPDRNAKFESYLDVRSFFML
jgi:hypothetical protein